MIRLAAIVLLLPSLAVAQTLTAQQRDAILNSVSDTGTQAAFTKPVLLYFTQASCSPCRRVEALQRDANVAKWLRNGFEFRRLDISQAGSVYDVYRTPTHIVLAGGKEIMRFEYVVSAADYARKLNAAWRTAGGGK